MESVTNLKELAAQNINISNPDDKAEAGSVMEFVLEELHQHSVLNKKMNGISTSYGDYVVNIFNSLSDEFEMGIED